MREFTFKLVQKVPLSDTALLCLRMMMVEFEQTINIILPEARVHLEEKGDKQ